ncbi:hypothetical protein FLM48_15775 [Shewanella sp. Scap07]|uniref:hypothetical protein n=1 Tax=Shewanella sp. Scap07 TaxID=2589987 RepID=UPI0015BA8A46|nr:hypothetical protein [Shewanella sp. Scap07]QLE86403.1 hypothetical protein FLM48_15775 [Shewanella sp. Scap07]
MTLGMLVFLSVVHIAVWCVSPFVFIFAIFQQREFELSKSGADIGLILWLAYSISTIVSVILVSYYYFADSQASYYWWFAMAWAALVVLITYLKIASKGKAI